MPGISNDSRHLCLFKPTPRIYMDAYTIDIDGNKRTVKPQDETQFSMEEIKTLLSCSEVQQISIYNGQIMLSDRQPTKDAKTNVKASLLYLLDNGPIKGKVLVCHPKMIRK